MSKSICLYRCREMARNNNAFSLGPMLEKEKLAANGGNYADWFRNLGFVLKVAKKDYVLKEALPAAPAQDASQDDKNVYATKVDDHTAVQCLMLTCMDIELQKRYENFTVYDMVKQLNALYLKQARTERYEITKQLWECKMAEGSSISEHVIKLVGYAQRLSDLGFAIPATLGADILLASLPPSYNGFIMNYNMNGLDKTTDELFAMLKTAEASMQKDPSHVLAVMNTTSFKKKGKGRNAKSGGKTKAPVKTKSGPTKDSECHYCKNKGHWKRNCKKYLGDLKSGLITKGINKLY